MHIFLEANPKVLLQKIDWWKLAQICYQKRISASITVTSCSQSDESVAEIYKTNCWKIRRKANDISQNDPRVESFRKQNG
ncbi:hypothetical protein DPMN_162181 [Dreissena polymorpha]|uniref:Uncharacterized protein n=1 Tax=Dreissena polymorpha TaxID=45954 RepID=A0A9D4ERT9_DREPO|nr:hypothetical protein DPMN_162181 [Dreissena polymorpha]